jgi:hypothetical protein
MRSASFGEICGVLRSTFACFLFLGVCGTVAEAGVDAEIAQCSTDCSRFHYSGSLYYPADVPSAGSLDRFGQLVAMQQGLAAVVDSSEFEPNNSMRFDRSDRVFTFRESGNQWELDSQFRTSQDPWRKFRTSGLGINEGSILVLGSVLAPDSGYQYLLEQYGKVNGEWLKLHSVTLDIPSRDALSAAVLRVSGGRAYVATRSANGAEVFIFTLTSDGPVLIERTGRIDDLGSLRIFSMDVETDLIAIGASNWVEGKVVLLTRGAESWSTSAVILDPDQQPYDRFGQKVEIAGNLLAVSASNRPVGDGRRGVVIPYLRDPNGWSRQSVIAPPESQQLDAFFGECLDLTGSSLLVCNASPHFSPHLYEYAIDGDVINGSPRSVIWTQSPSNIGNTIISSIVRVGSRIVAGYPQARVNYIRDQGAVAFLSVLAPNSIERDWKWLAQNREFYNFGSDVAADNEWLAVGVPGLQRLLNLELRSLGSVRVYRRVEGSWSFVSEIFSRWFESGFGSEVRFAGGELVVAQRISAQGPPRTYLRRHRFANGQWAEFGVVEFPNSAGRTVFRLEQDFVAIYQPELRKLSIRRLDDQWSVWAELDTPGDPQLYHLDAPEIAVSRNAVAITARDVSGTFVQIYDRAGDNWLQGDSLRLVQPIFQSRIGGSMSLGENGLVLTESDASDSLRNVFFFPRTSAGWGPAEPVPAPSGYPLWGFGSAVLIDNQRLLVGSLHCRSNFPCEETSQVLIYERGSSGWEAKEPVTVSPRPNRVHRLEVSEAGLLVGIPGSDPLNEYAFEAGEVVVLARSGAGALIFGDGFEP